MGEYLKQGVHLIIFAALMVLAGCSDGKSVRQLPHLGDTPYQTDSILVTTITNPERALTLLDSALLLGNISEYRGQFIRAKIQSKSVVVQQQDSAITLCKSLRSHDSVRNEPTDKMNIFDMLIAISRIRHDDNEYLRWATQKATLCQQQGEENERWRTEAEIGLLMTFLGQVDQGVTKIDEAISHLDSPGSIDRMDAFIIAVKRKINALSDLERYDEVISLAQRILDRLDHYEQHTKDYAEDSFRLSWSDNPSDRDRYLDFSHAQAWGFMAQAYAKLYEKSQEKNGEYLQKAKEYLSLFDNSNYGKTLIAHRFIAPAQMSLGMYDEALATYAELERRMGGDTLNDDYTVILRSRAIAARSKGHLAEAYNYQVRYANLAEVLNDSLHASEAHEHAARYHAQEQQLEIQEKQAEADRLHIVSITIAIIALLAIAFAIYFFRQKRIISEKNHVLIRMINDSMAASSEAPGTASSSETDELFAHIDQTIRNEKLYKNIHLQRQDICDRFGISRHTLNDVLAEHTAGLSFPQYVNSIRLEETLLLLHNEPAKTVSAIASEVGFTPANLREQFKRKYGVTPAEYRQNQ